MNDELSGGKLRYKICFISSDLRPYVSIYCKKHL